MPKIIRADQNHIAELARLFNLYRVFYEQPSDEKLAYKFVKERIDKDESVVFVFEEHSGKLNGFVQLYASFCSVSAVPILILYDLYVEQERRGEGIGRKLMDCASQFAELNGYARLELSTAKDNHIGQSLYESLGYELDDEFLHYSLDVK
jgi:ribosomal protein S18 acetylase RimI-like enzyme